MLLPCIVQVLIISMRASLEARNLTDLSNRRVKSASRCLIAYLVKYKTVFFRSPVFSHYVLEQPSKNCIGTLVRLRYSTPIMRESCVCDLPAPSHRRAGGLRVAPTSPARWPNPALPWPNRSGYTRNNGHHRSRPGAGCPSA